MTSNDLKMTSNDLKRGLKGTKKTYDQKTKVGDPNDDNITQGIISYKELFHLIKWLSL